ncbi:hypothetical protein [Heyndrickxia camelliae]|nr:hypothetical protein [Heyndrickxia camelliae]
MAESLVGIGMIYHLGAMVEKCAEQNNHHRENRYLFEHMYAIMCIWN